MKTWAEQGYAAFPVTEGQHIDPEHGMTLRDYFAAKAMQELLAQCNSFPDHTWRDGIAIDAYAMADVMLKVRQG